MDLGGHNEISGILDKRRQNLKFHWKTYHFTLQGRKLSYFKIRGSDDKEGELWGTIDIQDVLSLVSVATMGHRYPMEMKLRSGKVILLGADSSAERMRWLQAIQETMVAIRKSRRSSDTPVMRGKQLDLSRGICDWMSKSNPGSEVGSPVSSEGKTTDIPATDVLTDLDTFIDRTFNGITFNRQSQLGIASEGVSQPTGTPSSMESTSPSESSSHNT